MRRKLLLCGAMLCVACTNIEPSSSDQVAGTDADGDGHPASVDCDDGDPEVHPEAPERRNCRDDDCDGKIDEQTPNADLDGDGYCPSTGDVGDCEGNAQRHPGMGEDGGDGSNEPNDVDDNCNGTVDEGLPGSDADGDGFTVAGGDCNDSDPHVNPGAIEVIGLACSNDEDCPSGDCRAGYCRCGDDDGCSSLDTCFDDEHCTRPGERCDGKLCRGTWSCLDAPEGLEAGEAKVCRENADNDCDGETDELALPCDALGELDRTDPFDFARAIELCDTDHTCGVDRGCPGELACVEGRCRRVLRAEFNVAADARSRALGATLSEATSELFKPRAGAAMAILSSGLAEYDASDCPQSGTPFSEALGVDPDPNAIDRAAHDVSQLSLEILVPTNARSFSFDFQFLTSEYPEYLDSEYNDTFWVQLDGKQHSGNISFDKHGTPIRLNNAFFDICDPDPNQNKTLKFCARPGSDLAGTGYDKCAVVIPGPSDPGDTSVGGSTGWLTTVAPVEPGERITLTFTIFDKGDTILDSTVLIDNFRWKLSPASKPITAPK